MDAKAKITEIVGTYIQLCPDEYFAFKDSIEEKRGNLTDRKFGTASHSGMEMRALFDMPVTLHDLLVKQLNEDQLEWFKSKDGARWFANTFKVFMLPDAI